MISDLTKMYTQNANETLNAAFRESSTPCVVAVLKKYSLTEQIKTFDFTLYLALNRYSTPTASQF